MSWPASVSFCFYEPWPGQILRRAAGSHERGSLPPQLRLNDQNALEGGHPKAMCPVLLYISPWQGAHRLHWKWKFCDSPSLFRSNSLVGFLPLKNPSAMESCGPCAKRLFKIPNPPLHWEKQFLVHEWSPWPSGWQADWFDSYGISKYFKRPNRFPRASWPGKQNPGWRLATSSPLFCAAPASSSPSPSKSTATGDAAEKLLCPTCWGITWDCFMMGTWCANRVVTVVMRFGWCYLWTRLHVWVNMHLCC